MAARGSAFPGSRTRRWERAGQSPAVASRRVVLYFARRYLGLSRDEWDELGWDTQQVYLEGMEADESVPLTFERQEVREAMPEDMRWSERKAEGASVIDITGMIAGLEASRHGGGR